ncbi:hypothetical protein [Yeguia hominis]|uniref:Uncharacterized protein n=1 Tax=Yeguia hominis TaxID=2763662 RepID=A0A926HT61_9FIRM|nr:hypothetical protein [Yeguia hominis]MBC8534141.1 hypothetical protein [Yeguia hominis]
MICPYNMKSQVSVQQWMQEYGGENGDQTPAGTTITNEQFEYMECAREDCGAFYDGRCHYNG